MAVIVFSLFAACCILLRVGGNDFSVKLAP
jgi:hypothetical protein